MRDKLENEELKGFIDKHSVIYIRHIMDSTPQVYQKLISEGIVAVHYSLRKDVDPENLKNYEEPENYTKPGRRVLKRFRKYCEKGAIIIADYSDTPNESIEKTANIGILRASGSYDVIRYFGHHDYPKGFVYKQAELCNYKRLAKADFELFLAIHPRGGTMIHWWEGEMAVKFLYKKLLGLPIDPESIGVGTLFPAQQEVLCSEYLRQKAPDTIRLKYFLLPVGRGMKTIDIDGVNDQTRVFAQVSFSKRMSEIKEKITDLQDIGRGYQDSRRRLVLLYFGPKDAERFVRKATQTIEFVTLEEVFNVMKDTGILNDMLGIRLCDQ